MSPVQRCSLFTWLIVPLSSPPSNTAATGIEINFQNSHKKWQSWQLLCWSHRCVWMFHIHVVARADFSNSFRKYFLSVSSEVMASESDPIKLFSSNQSALYKAVDAVNQTEDNIQQQHQHHQQQQQQQQHQADISTGSRISSNAWKSTCESLKVLIVWEIVFLGWMRNIFWQSTTDHWWCSDTDKIRLATLNQWIRATNQYTSQTHFFTDHHPPTVISLSFLHHFSIISSSFLHHSFIISSSFLHHFFIISSSFLHHFFIFPS